jgi:hypothetical protein
LEGARGRCCCWVVVRGIRVERLERLGSIFLRNRRFCRVAVCSIKVERLERLGSTVLRNRRFCRVAVRSIRVERLERLGSIVLRNRRSCGRSDSPRPEIVVSCGRRPLPLREGGVPVVASPLGPDHALEVVRLAVWVRHGWRGCSLMSGEIEKNRVLRFPELVIIRATVAACCCCSCVC